MHLPRPLSRWVDLTVFAPIGLLTVLREQWPQCSKQAAQNRQAVRNRIQLAQLAARMAADRAQQGLRPDGPAVAVVAATAPAATPASSSVTSSRTPFAVPSPTPAATPSPTDGPDDSDSSVLATVTELRPRSRAQDEGGAAGASGNDDAVEASSLPISDYESLAAIHVVHRLPTLRPDELENVRRFERSHRARRTVLAKIEQLQETET